jgi:hypothetical protein
MSINIRSNDNDNCEDENTDDENTEDENTDDEKQINTNTITYDDSIDDCLFDNYIAIKNASKKLSTEKNLKTLSKKPGTEEIPSDVFTNKASEIGRFWSVDVPLKSESLKLLRELVKFYTDDKLEKLIVPRAIKSLALQKKYELSNIIKEEINGISLRAIEWLVTNYSKGTKIVLYNEIQKKRVDIHDAYEIQSNHYKRNLFDPFCRHGRVYFMWRLKPIKTKLRKQEKQDKQDKTSQTPQTPQTPQTLPPSFVDIVLVTTVGQLNFMKWADEHGILTYAHNHQQEIQNTMESTLSKVNKEKKQFKKLGQRRKRKELTKAPDIYCSVYSVDTVLQLDNMDSPRRY